MYLLNCKSLFLKVVQLIHKIMDSIFRKCFASFEGQGLKSSPFLIYQPLKINQKANMTSLWNFTFWKLRIETIKNSKHHLLKINRSQYITILFRSSKGLELLPNFHSRAKNKLEMFVKNCTSV